jgi:hypothetical protein
MAARAVLLLRRCVGSQASDWTPSFPVRALEVRTRLGVGHSPVDECVPSAPRPGQSDHRVPRGAGRFKTGHFDHRVFRGRGGFKTGQSDHRVWAWSKQLRNGAGDDRGGCGVSCAAARRPKSCRQTLAAAYPPCLAPAIIRGCQTNPHPTQNGSRKPSNSSRSPRSWYGRPSTFLSQSPSHRRPRDA